jgi:hypothetical protein
MAFNFPRTADGWMSVISAVLLTGYFVFALYALFSPSDDPQRGMAQGFITMVAVLLLSLGGALWFAVARNHPWLLRIIFVIVIFPALSQTAQEIYLLMRRAP